MNVKPELSWIINQSGVILRFRFLCDFESLFLHFNFFNTHMFFCTAPPAPPPKIVYIYFYNFVINFFSFSFSLSPWEMYWVLKILNMKSNCSISEHKAITVLYSKGIYNLFGISILFDISTLLEISWVIKC